MNLLSEMARLMEAWKTLSELGALCRKSWKENGQLGAEKIKRGIALSFHDR